MKLRTFISIGTASVFFVGCSTWEKLPDAAQNALKGLAKAALVLGVSQLGDRVKEVRPYQDKLLSLIDTTFAKALSAEQLGKALGEGVKSVVPANMQDVVLGEFNYRLLSGPVAAEAGVKVASTGYNVKLANAMIATRK